MSSPKNINLADAIKGARTRAEMSLTEMARLAGYSLQHLSRVENGHAEVTADLMANVAKVLKEPRLVVAYWDVRIGSLTGELKLARQALKEAKARAASTSR